MHIARLTCRFRIRSKLAEYSPLRFFNGDAKKSLMVIVNQRGPVDGILVVRLDNAILSFYLQLVQGCNANRNNFQTILSSNTQSINCTCTSPFSKA